MKKTLLLSMALLAINCVIAQFEKGTKFISGNATFSIQNSKTDGNSGNNTSSNKNGGYSINLLPAYNKFISNSVFETYSISLSGSSNNSTFSANGTDMVKSKNGNYGFGIGYGRTKLFNLSNKLMLGVGYGLNTNYSHYTSKQNNNNVSTSDMYSIGGNIYPSLFYKLNSRVMLSTNLTNFLSAHLSHTVNVNSSSPNTTKSNDLNVSGITQSFYNLGYLNFGIAYKLK